MDLFKKLLKEVTVIPPVLDTRHFATLDGLRGISIILVIFHHLALSNHIVYNIVFNGDLGVDIFFVLSGFLITTLCIKEKVTTSQLNLQNFYIRRILRIIPVAFLFLFVMVILNYVLKLHLDFVIFLAAALFVYNISNFRNYPYGLPLSHFWSLATEEQFYVVFPVILKKNYKLYVVLILVLVFIMPIVIYLLFSLPVINKGAFLLITHFLIKFQGIATGCLFAVLVFNRWFNSSLLAKNRAWINLILIVSIFMLRFQTNFNPHKLLSNFLISLFVGFFIATNLSPGRDFVFRFLNNKILIRVGILSYSIYIWQQIFTLPILPAPFSTLPYNLICLAIVSTCSFYFYERYFINIKKKFQNIKS